MARKRKPDNDPFQRFARGVWKKDVAPLLRDQRASQREKYAKRGGKWAGATGLAVDKLLRLKGRPFGRALTVLGSTWGALLPDAWDWQWLRTEASAAERDAVADKLKQRARELPEADALDLFDLTPRATQEQLKQAWREVARRWHPDKARDEAQRREFHLRFVAYQAAYEQLQAAYAAGRLPV